MKAQLGWPLAVCALAGCAARAPPRPAAPPVVIEAIAVTTTYIAAHVPRSSRGQFAIVEVCVTEDGSIDAARVTRSSNDSSFDAQAMQWARMAHYRPQLENGRPVYGCGEVRVEVNRNPRPRIDGADSALG